MLEKGGKGEKGGKWGKRRETEGNGVEETKRVGRAAGAWCYGKRVGKNKKGMRDGRGRGKGYCFQEGNRKVGTGGRAMERGGGGWRRGRGEDVLIWVQVIWGKTPQ
jgi:hypothetical protein